MNIITLDCETLPIISYTWGIWDQNVGLNQIAEDTTICAAAWKQLGQSKVEYLDTRGDPRNDFKLCLALRNVLDKADIVIGQNHQSFDLKRINARLLIHRIPPPSPYRTFDTKVVVKRVAAFTSNKLEHLSKVLTDAKKQDHREFPGFELWREVMADNARAWNVMKRYNIADVRATEELFERLRPWAPAFPTIAPVGSDACPRCAGKDTLSPRGFLRTAAGMKPRYRCGACYGWSVGKLVKADRSREVRSV